MRTGWHHGRDGKLRLWLDVDDIEAIMESELRKAGLFPTPLNPVVDLETFIEKYLGVSLDQYAELEPSVLGQTEFYPNRPPRVLINRDLTGAAMDEDDTPAGVLGRWRATLAHEASHVILHRILFELDGAEGNLFGDNPEARNPQRLMRCLKANVLFRNSATDWREFQANRAMAALLMPRTVFKSIAADAIERLRLGPDEFVLGSLIVRQLAGEISSLFEVSKQATIIRLETFGFLVEREQPRLGFG